MELGFFNNLAQHASASFFLLKPHSFLLCRHLFTAHTYLELQQNEEALQIYFGLTGAGLQDSTYLMAQVAIAFHNMRQVDQAVEYFRQLSEVDPYR